MRYSFNRDPTAQSRMLERDSTSGVVYVYVRFTDRVDVYKFGSHEIDVAPDWDDLIPVTTPRYRVSGGQCTCPGFEYRKDCRHVEKVKRWNDDHGE